MNEIHKLAKKLNDKGIYEEYVISYSRHAEGSIFETQLGKYIIEFKTDDIEIIDEAKKVCKLIDSSIPLEYGFDLTIDNSDYSLEIVISEGLNGAAHFSIEIDGNKSVTKQLEDVDWLAYQTDTINKFQDIQEHQDSLNKLGGLFPTTTELRKELNFLAKKWLLKAKKKSMVYGYISVDPRDTLNLEEHYKGQIHQDVFENKEQLYGAITDSLGCGLHPIWIKCAGEKMKADAIDHLKRKLINDNLRDGSISKGNALLLDIEAMEQNSGYF